MFSSFIVCKCISVFLFSFFLVFIVNLIHSFFHSFGKLLYFILLNPSFASLTRSIHLKQFANEWSIPTVKQRISFTFSKEILQRRHCKQFLSLSLSLSLPLFLSKKVQDQNKIFYYSNFFQKSVSWRENELLVTHQTTKLLKLYPYRVHMWFKNLNHKIVTKGKSFINVFSQNFPVTILDSTIFSSVMKLGSCFVLRLCSPLLAPLFMRIRNVFSASYIYLSLSLRHHLRYSFCLRTLSSVSVLRGAHVNYSYFDADCSCALLNNRNTITQVILKKVFKHLLWRALICKTQLDTNFQHLF